MENRDWIILFIPILFNGFLIFIFQKYINSKIEKINKRNRLRDEVVLLFWQKLQELNYELIQTNDNVQQNRLTLQEGISNIRNKIIEIIKYYDTNTYDLQVFEKYYSDWNNSWNNFCSIPKHEQNPINLGEKLNNFKHNTVEFIKLIRENY